MLKGPGYATGSDIITNAVRGGRCKEFGEYGLGLRLNRKRRKTWIGIVLERNAVLRGKKKAVWTESCTCRRARHFLHCFHGGTRRVIGT